MTQFLKTKSGIKNWLDCHNIEDYTLLPDDTYGHVIDVDGNVAITYGQLTHIPVKFNRVEGHFHCHDNCLTTLLGCPEHVEGTFHCSDNQLTSLLHCPKIVGESFYCHQNKITSLLGVPTHINENFHCGGNLLTSLQGTPQTIEGYFDCSDNRLKSLEYCPQSVGGSVNFEGNSDLGGYQSIENFSQIYEIHLQYVNIKKEQQSLHHEIQCSVKNDKKYKI